MAEHAVSTDSHHGDMAEHRNTYEGFVKGSIALSLICFFVLVALVSFRFAHTLSVFTGAVGLILGIIAVIIDSRVGGRWLLSLGLLVIFGLITAINVS
jgi:Bacterial aa3 type cytochrome c oxidase subunit IV